MKKVERAILSQLQRITSTGERLIYIDGLRFFAISSVFLFHYMDYYEDMRGQDTELSFFNGIVGSISGVTLFFSISGFIIAMPFYRFFTEKAGKFRVQDYLFRRFTRLEPPYFIHLLILFILTVFILQTKSFSATFPHLLASLIYSHELIYHEQPLLNTCLWSLEVEIQFYLLAPVIALAFKLSKLYRRIIFISLILIFVLFRPINISYPTVFMFMHYFLTGFLAYDIYKDFIKIKRYNILSDVVCFLSLGFLWFSTKDYIDVFLILILLVVSSSTRHFRKMLEFPWIYTIGGMCYSIYMLHQKIIYSMSNILPEKAMGGNVGLDMVLRFILYSIATMIVSSAFFILIERPAMRKNWWRIRRPKLVLGTKL